MMWLLVNDAYIPGAAVAKIAPTPLLLIHSTKDPIIVPEHSLTLYERARGSKKLWMIPGVGHTQAFTQYVSKYRRRLVAFNQEAMPAGIVEPKH